MKKRTGRTTKLTRTNINKVCNFIANGAFFGQACLLANISRSQCFKWVAEGQREEFAGTLQEEFYRKKLEAEAKWEQLHLQNINVKSRDDWKASAWALERKYPERYGRNRIEIVGDNGGPVNVETTATVTLYIPDNGRDKQPE